MVEFRMDFLSRPRSRTLTPTEVQQSLPFHVIECGEYCTGDGYYTKRDGLQNYLLIVTLEGCGRMTWGGQSCLLEPGSAVLIDCSSYQEYATLPGRTWHFLYLHLGALSVEGYRGVLLRRLTPAMLRAPQTVRERMEQLYTVAGRTNAAAHIVASDLISGILTEMVCSLTDGAESDSAFNRPDIAALAEFIRNHFYEELHIDDFMKQTRLSRHYLIHVFERQIGMSPYRYLHMCRINHAQHLLRTTDMTVVQIAYGIGYHTPAVFIRHFKSFNGITPVEYRRESVRTASEK